MIHILNKSAMMMMMMMKNHPERNVALNVMLCFWHQDQRNAAAQLKAPSFALWSPFKWVTFLFGFFLWDLLALAFHLTAERMFVSLSDLIRVVYSKSSQLFLSLDGET